MIPIAAHMTPLSRKELSEALAKEIWPKLDQGKVDSEEKLITELIETLIKLGRD